jgi:hypothetical protein
VKRLRLFKCIDLNGITLVHAAFRNQFKHAWVYSPICQGARIITLFTLPETRREDSRAVITCMTCFQYKVEYDAAHRTYEKKVLRR